MNMPFQAAAQLPDNLSLDSFRGIVSDPDAVSGFISQLDKCRADSLMMLISQVADSGNSADHDIVLRFLLAKGAIQSLCAAGKGDEIIAFANAANPISTILVRYPVGIHSTGIVITITRLAKDYIIDKVEAEQLSAKQSMSDLRLRP
jgi:hypothetical protein